VDGLTAIVVVPARDEQEHIGACLEALGAQSVGAAAFEVIVVLDACLDDTESVVAAAGAEAGLAVTMIAGPGQGSGPARRVGMDHACARMLALNRPDGLIATTDADSRPAADWLQRQLTHRDAGASVIAGRIELDPAEAAQLPAAARRVREQDATTRLRVVRRGDPDAGHHHFAGASLAVTAATYRVAGGLGAEQTLEDEAFGQRLAARGIPVLRAADVVVMTSARANGRAARGLSVDLAVAGWLARRRLRATDYDLGELRALHDPRRGVTVIIPTRECADTVGEVLDRAVAPVREAGVVDDVVVVDAASRDGTAQVAAAHGARVVQQDEIAPGLGPALGKGDAMWRALQATGGELVCFMDGDTGDPQPAHLIGLVGPLLADPSIAMVRGAFSRPFTDGGRLVQDEGGRVTELMARPLINLHAPLLAGFRQPLAGEFAARRDLLEEIPFPAGYGVEIATLLDALARHGLDALAECDLGTRQNRHQSLRALGEMAYAVLAAMERRLPGARSPISGRYVRPWEDGSAAAIAVLERPPLQAWRTPDTARAAVASGVRER
jgi:glycosyltransferase involved in cell wall biosynthesis